MRSEVCSQLHPPRFTEYLADAESRRARLFEKCRLARAINHLSSARGLRHFKCNHLKCANNQRIDTVFNIGLFVEYLDINGHAFPFVAQHVSQKYTWYDKQYSQPLGSFFSS